MVIPKNLIDEYPFSSRFLNLNDDLKLHYIDEGRGETILMVHGNPTWSFFYRNLVKSLAATHRVIAFDHIGCGLSDKPQDWSYTLKNHIQNLQHLITHLKLKNITLILHDWGGAIGMGYATRHPENIKKIVILNTAAFTSQEIPFRISLCRLPFIGEGIVRGLNGFALPATFMAVSKKMPDKIKKGYLLPYNSYKNRIAISRFVKDIPLSENHPSHSTLQEIEDRLSRLTCPKMILWGGKDFCFNMNFFKRWRNIYPKASYFVFPEAGHYLLEDAPKEISEKIKDFLKGPEEKTE